MVVAFQFFVVVSAAAFAFAVARTDRNDPMEELKQSHPRPVPRPCAWPLERHFKPRVAFWTLRLRMKLSSSGIRGVSPHVTSTRAERALEKEGSSLGL